MDPDPKDHHGRTPLSLATIEYPNLDLVRILLTTGKITPTLIIVESTWKCLRPDYFVLDYTLEEKRVFREIYRLLLERMQLTNGDYKPKHLD